ncbi:hypothetical protein ANCCAN_05530 [Ancylostoma caninum]|uniref:Secreted protein n=1 Tax=Ancylostoma caninum TaxID=29170 RepID=A0A368GVI6_ANCCA|nr:hypothetical protein ANCCAN_05530 [Ancylostoma caninum]
MLQVLMWQHLILWLLTTRRTERADFFSSCHIKDGSKYSEGVIREGSLIDLSDDECNDTDQTIHTSTTAKIHLNLTQSESVVL